MKAVVYDAPRSFSITEIAEPTPGPGEVLIKVIQTGICGTDLHIHRGRLLRGVPPHPRPRDRRHDRRRRRQRHQLPDRGTGDGQPQHQLRPLPRLPQRPATAVQQPQGHRHQLARRLRRVPHRTRRLHLHRRGARRRHRRGHRTRRLRHARPGNPPGHTRQHRPGLRSRTHRTAAVPLCGVGYDIVVDAHRRARRHRSAR